MNEKLLEINRLSVSFANGGERTRAVRDLSLSVENGQVVGLVGESGSGKTVTAMSVAGLLRSGKKTDIRGTIRFRGRPLLKDGTPVRHRRPNISMIFQDPVDSLNPAFTVGRQIAEVFRVQKNMDKAAARSRAVEMLKTVNIPSPETAAGRYPHQLSGGMCQRAMIAIALAAEPDLLIADEPTTALDVTIQAQILHLLHRLYRDTKTAILFITHDLGIVAQFCHRVAIMLEGQIVEEGTVADIFNRPLHPYTRGLLDSIPVMGSRRRLSPMAPATEASGNGRCRFSSRCHRKTDDCDRTSPDLAEDAPGHFVRCTMGGTDTKGEIAAGTAERRKAAP